jgi:hypothetical protein
MLNDLVGARLAPARFTEGSYVREFGSKKINHFLKFTVLYKALK